MSMITVLSMVFWPFKENIFLLSRARKTTNSRALLTSRDVIFFRERRSVRVERLRYRGRISWSLRVSASRSSVPGRIPRADECRRRRVQRRERLCRSTRAIAIGDYGFSVILVSSRPFASAAMMRFEFSCRSENRRECWRNGQAFRC